MPFSVLFYRRGSYSHFLQEKWENLCLYYINVFVCELRMCHILFVQYYKGRILFKSTADKKNELHFTLSIFY